MSKPLDPWGFRLASCAASRLAGGLWRTSASKRPRKRSLNLCTSSTPGRLTLIEWRQKATLPPEPARAFGDTGRKSLRSSKQRRPHGKVRIKERLSLQMLLIRTVTPRSSKREGSSPPRPVPAPPEFGTSGAPTKEVCSPTREVCGSSVAWPINIIIY
jgi:hypothetical protein